MNYSNFMKDLGQVTHVFRGTPNSRLRQLVSWQTIWIQIMLHQTWGIIYDFNYLTPRLYTVKSRYLKVDWTTFLKVQITRSTELICTSGNFGHIKKSKTPNSGSRMQSKST